jgi:putative chitinase
VTYLQKYQEVLGLKPDGVIGKMTAAAMMKDLGITDKLFFAHLIGQMAHESGNFTHARENLNYSADGLIKTWPARFNKSNAWQYHRQPEKIANKVYAGRMGNGDESSGDGWKYRGIFGLQLTGKDNITRFMKSIGVQPNTDPETLLADPRNYFLSGLFWFKDNGVDKLCTSITDDCIKKVSKRVNGGYIGLDDRIAKTKAIYKALNL